jgi:hypothetical protein
MYRFVINLIISLSNTILLFHTPCASASALSHNIKFLSQSQASQDQFVYSILYKLLGKEDKGYYLEIGAWHPSIGNNTFSFERDFGWNGVSIDISNTYQSAWSLTRHNPLLIEDATESDYASILSTFPPLIDYLSLDIDSGYDKVLERMPLDKYTFKVITIEHDFYRFGDEFRAAERRILESFGYRLLCPNVSILQSGIECTFEDWWIHPNAFPPEAIAMLSGLDLNGKNHENIMHILSMKLDCPPFALHP